MKVIIKNLLTKPCSTADKVLSFQLKSIDISLVSTSFIFVKKLEKQQCFLAEKSALLGVMWVYIVCMTFSYFYYYFFYFLFCFIILLYWLCEHHNKSIYL